MSAEQYTQNTGEVKRTTSEVDNNSHNPGPFVAVVTNHIDSQYMGRLEVVLQTKSGSGNSQGEPGKAVPVSYLSPFYGITPFKGVTSNEGHQFSQKSYGFWGVPPDIGSKVLVIFAEGGQGFWIGCIQEEYANMLVPGGPFTSTTFNSQDSTKKLPVAETNKRTEDGTQRNATKQIKPVNTDILEVLVKQGLDGDEFRGTTTSSARREVPSCVMGFSSPGPQDKREGAPRVTYGEDFAQTVVPQNRLGGSSLVFDDGDPTLLRKTPAGGVNGGPPEYVNIEAGDEGGNPTLPHNELVRLRTRTGHQILLHNTEDLIYIANAKGTTWIELTSNGKVDIYAASDVSIHSEADMNFKADGNMYFEAGANIHMKAGASIFQTSAANWEIKAGADGKISTAANLDLTSGADTRSQAGNTHWTAGSHKFQGTIDQNGPAPSAPGAAADAEPAQRVPEHEPWDGHENLHELKSSEVSTPDTFAQSTTRPAQSTPAVSAPGTQSEGNAGEAEARANVTGVLQSPAAETALSGLQGLPSAVSNAVSSLTDGINNVSVGNLRNAIDFGTIRFPSAQNIIREIDRIASPSGLQNIINGVTDTIQGVAGTITETAASGLREIRTRLARVNT